MQVESKILSKCFLIFILELLINTVLPLRSNSSPPPRSPPPTQCLFNLEALRGSPLEGRDIFLIKAAFGSEALIRGLCGAYLRADAYKRKCSKTEDAQYS